MLPGSLDETEKLGTLVLIVRYHAEAERSFSALRRLKDVVAQFHDTNLAA